MTDEQMDARLHAAGERWRATDDAMTPGVATAVRIDGLPDTERPAPRRRHARLAVAASIAVVLGAAGVVVALVHGGTSSPAHPATNGATPPAALSLYRTDWRLVDPAPPAGAAPKQAWLLIDADHFGAGDGCNSVSGEVRVGTGSIRFGAVASTAIGCLDGPWTQITATIDRVLNGAVSWSIAADRLTLRKGADVLVYRAAPTPITDPRALAGSTWRLTSVTQLSGTGPDANASSPGTVLASRLVFDATATHLTVEQRCHGFATGVHAATGTLTIDPYLNDATLCADDGVPRILTGRVQWHIQSDVLTIVRPGIGILVFSRV